MKAKDGIKKRRTRHVHNGERTATHHATQLETKLGQSFSPEHLTKATPKTSLRGHRAQSARIRIRKRNSSTTHPHSGVTA